MEIETTDQRLLTEDDGLKGLRDRPLSEEEAGARMGKKSKGAGMDDLAMDDVMIEGGVGEPNPNQTHPVSPEEKMTEVKPDVRCNLVSYKDKLLRLNGKGGQSDDEEEGWVAKQKREDEEEELVEGLSQDAPDDPLCLRYTFSMEEHKKDCEKWRKALIIKLLGKRIGSNFLMTRLQRLWGLVSSVVTIDLDNGYLLLRFHDDSDYRHVLEEGPWIVNDHYVVVQRWRPFLIRMMRVSGNWLSGSGFLACQLSCIPFVTYGELGIFLGKH